MLTFKAVGKASAKYVFLLFALVAIASLTYESGIVTIAFLLLLGVLIAFLLMKVTDQFPRRYLFIAIPGFIISVINNYNFVDRINAEFPWQYLSVLLFILPGIPYCFFESQSSPKPTAP